MIQIASIIKLPEKKKGQPRNIKEECIQWFVDNLKNKQNKKFSYICIKMKLSHLKENMDYTAFRSVCADIQNRKGNEAMNKYFWFSLKPNNPIK